MLGQVDLMDGDVVCAEECSPVSRAGDRVHGIPIVHEALDQIAAVLTGSARDDRNM